MDFCMFTANLPRWDGFELYKLQTLQTLQTCPCSFSAAPPPYKSQRPRLPPYFVQVIESGTVYDPKVMDITDDDVMSSVITAIREVAALSLGAKYPSLAAAPHIIIDGYKNVLAIALEVDYTFPLAQKVK